MGGALIDPASPSSRDAAGLDVIALLALLARCVVVVVVVAGATQARALDLDRPAGAFNPLDPDAPFLDQAAGVRVIAPRGVDGHRVGDQLLLASPDGALAVQVVRVAATTFEELQAQALRVGGGGAVATQGAVGVVVDRKGALSSISGVLHPGGWGVLLAVDAQVGSEDEVHRLASAMAAALIIVDDQATREVSLTVDERRALSLSIPAALRDELRATPAGPELALYDKLTLRVRIRVVDRTRDRRDVPQLAADVPGDTGLAELDAFTWQKRSPAGAGVWLRVDDRYVVALTTSLIDDASADLLVKLARGTRVTRR